LLSLFCFFFLQEGLLLPRKYVVPAAKYPSVRSMVRFTSCNVEVCKLRNLVAPLMLATSIMMTWLVSLEFLYRDIDAKQIMLINMHGWYQGTLYSLNALINLYA